MAQIVNGDTGLAARTAINFALPDLVAFTATVPLNGTKVMTAQVVASVIAFTAGATQLFGSCYVRLTANGNHVPTFTGFVEHGSSAGYSNTNGVINLINFWFDGVTSWYSISQGINAPVAPIPTLSFAADVSQAEGNSGAKLYVYTVTRSSAVGAVSVPWTFSAGDTDAADYTGGVLPTGGNVAMADGVSSGTITISVNGDTTNEPNEPFSVGISAPSGYALGSKSSATGMIVNDDAASSGFIRMTTISSRMTETVNGGGGYNYTANSAVNYGNEQGWTYSSARLPASQDGFFGIKINASVTAGAMIGLSTQATPQAWNTMLLGGFVGDGPWSVIVNGSALAPSAVQSPTNVAAGDLARTRRAGTTAYFEVSHDNGTTWLTVHTITGISTAALTPVAVTGSNTTAGQIIQPFASVNVQ